MAESTSGRMRALHGTPVACRVAWVHKFQRVKKNSKHGVIRNFITPFFFEGISHVLFQEALSPHVRAARAIPVHHVHAWHSTHVA
jgi:hypothetical protein